MTTITITPQLKVTMLKHLVAGKDLDFVATTTRVPLQDVLDIVSNHGYPNKDRMAWAVDVLIQGGDKIPQSQLRTGTPLDPVAAATPVRTAGGRPSNFALIPPVVIAHVPPATTDLLRQAEQSPFIRTQNIGAKISALLADLTARLNDEQQQVEAKAQADRESARIASRIATLQAEIDKLKRKTPKVAGVSHATRPVITGEHSCTTPGCDRTFPTIQGAVTHRRRAHEGFNPHAKAS